MYSWSALKNACLQINYLTLTLIACVVCSCQKSEHLTVTLFTPLIAFDVMRTQHIIFGFLWYSVGIPVVLKGDLFTMRVSSYVFIFCAILNNLARFIYVISNRQVLYSWAA